MTRFKKAKDTDTEMYCSRNSFLLYTLAAAAAIIVGADEPPKPEISETFSSWVSFNSYKVGVKFVIFSL